MCHGLTMSPPWLLLLLLLASSLLLLHSSTGSLSKMGRFYRLPYMDNFIIRTPPSDVSASLVARRVSITSVSQCALACLTEEQCSTFFYDSNGDECLLYSILFLGADEAVPNNGTTYWQLSQDSCPLQEDFILYRPLGLCYKYHSQAVDWDTAQASCSSAGTSLIEVDTLQKFDHLYLFLRGSNSTRKKHVSIGASSKNGPYLWEDGSAVTWTNWASGEPSSPAEKCVTMAWFYYFKWNDVPCASSDPIGKYHFLCQKN